jgi:hypothetical protein
MPLLARVFSLSWRAGCPGYFNISGSGTPMRSKAWRWVLAGCVSVGTVALAPARRTGLRSGWPGGPDGRGSCGRGGRPWAPTRSSSRCRTGRRSRSSALMWPDPDGAPGRCAGGRAGVLNAEPGGVRADAVSRSGAVLGETPRARSGGARSPRAADGAVNPVRAPGAEAHRRYRSQSATLRFAWPSALLVRSAGLLIKPGRLAAGRQRAPLRGRVGGQRPAAGSLTRGVPASRR